MMLARKSSVMLQSIGPRIVQTCQTEQHEHDSSNDDQLAHGNRPESIPTDLLGKISAYAIEAATQVLAIGGRKTAFDCALLSIKPDALKTQRPECEFAAKGE